MATKQNKDKYYLRSIHEEIDLYDRKLAHLLKYDTFASDKERDAAAEKLNSKRTLLVRDARSLIDSGIEYKPSELPRSLRTAEQLADESAIKQANHAIPISGLQPTEPIDLSSENTLPSLQKEIEEYLQKRHRTPNHSPAVAKGM